MTAPLLLAMPGNERLTAELAAALGFELGQIETRQFPDGETYLRLLISPNERPTVIVCTLDRPSGKLLSLLFAAATARELGAAKVGLVAPYLAYMRQDRRFKPGEAVPYMSAGKCCCAHASVSDTESSSALPRLARTIAKSIRRLTVRLLPLRPHKTRAQRSAGRLAT